MSLGWDAALALTQRSGAVERATLLADGARSFRTHFEPDMLITLASGLVAAVLLIWLTSFFSGARRRLTAYNSPGRLFLALCRAHRLRWRDAWLLWQLARWHELEDPARLFLEPERFDREGLNRRLTRHAVRLRWLHLRLFAGLPEADAPPGPPTNSGAFGPSLSVPSPAGSPPPVDAIA
jgi:hypothetical protein